MTATYDGNANYITSASSASSQTVSKASTSLALGSSVEPSEYGQSVSLTASIAVTAPGGGVPTGAVTFSDANGPVGTATLDGAGNAVLNLTSLSVGAHSIVASYAGDSAYFSSASTALSQTVAIADTSAAVASSDDATSFGQSVAFVATVLVTAPGGGTAIGNVTFKDGSTVLGSAALNGSGFATFVTATLAPGAHSITAEYAGTSSYSPSVSSAAPQTVDVSDTSTTVTTSSNPASFGQTITISAAVSATTPGGGVPTGAVTFLDGATVLGSVAVDGTGQTTLNIATLAVGTHSITATYAGSSNYNASVSPVDSQIVNPSSTTSAVASSIASSVFGQSITLTATISAAAPGTGTPTGTVTFKEGATVLGTAAVNGSGVATLALSSLAVGSHSLLVAYGGDANNSASTSSSITQTVNQAATTTTLGSSTNPSVFGQTTTFTATVVTQSPGAATPSGTVTFKDGVTVLGSASLNGAGVATFAAAMSAVGTHSITAVYAGDANVLASTSAALSQDAQRAGSTTSISASASPSMFGQSVRFTATVFASAPGSGTPSGSVTFKDGATDLGTAMLDGSGIAILDVASLAAGSHSITAVFGISTNFTASTSSAIVQTVSPTATAASVTSSAGPSVFGQSVTLTATIASIAPGSGVPTGTVTFKDGSTVLGAGTINGSGIATFSNSSFSVGAHPITVIYGGDSNNQSSTSATLTQTVNTAATSTTLGTSTSPSVTGQTVTFTASIVTVSPGAGTPSGTVTFKDGVVTLGTATLNGSGIATFGVSSLSVGAHSITAVYAGDANDAPSTSASVSQSVQPADTSTSLSGSASPSTFGESVRFTAAVTAASPGAGTPGGTVEFFDGSASLGTGTLNGAGIAILDVASLAAGAHSITAAYGGSLSFNGSTSSGLSQTVDRSATTSTITSSAAPSAFGQSVTFTAMIASVAPGEGTPAGTVTFKEGATVLGSATLDSGGNAWLNVASLTVGDHSISAEYGGSASNLASTSSVITQTVDRDATMTTLTSSLTPTVYGQTATFTATVAAEFPGGGTPTGTVTFKNGSAVLGTTTLDASGVATFATSGLVVGAHSITAVYDSDANGLTSTSAALTQTVQRAGTTTSLASSVSPSSFGQSIRLTATVVAVAPGSGTPGGSVTFKDGSVDLGVGTLDGAGVAFLDVAGLAAGTHSITAVYGADADFTASTSPAFSQTIDLSATATSVVSSADPSVFGQTVMLTATIAAVSPGAGTPTGVVMFKEGSTVLGGAAVDGSGTAAVSISPLAVGAHSITAEYSGDANFQPSTSTAGSQNVIPTTTTTSIFASTNPSVFGQTATFTATVSPVSPGAGIASGSVTFMEGAAVLGTATLDAAGVATFGTSALSVATHSITAVYAGDTNDNGSTSATFTQTVQPAATTTSVSTSLSPSVFGQSVTLTAAVATSSPGAGTAGGAVSFFDGSTPLGTATLDGAGIARLDVSALNAGSHSITASFAGSATFAASTSSILSQSVNPAATTSAVTSSVSTSVYGQGVVLTASISATSPGAGVPIGTVVFKDGITVLGSSAVDGSGVATFPLSSFAVGAHSITAEFSGGANFGASTSTAIMQTVDCAATATALNSAINPSTFGQSVRLTATVATTAPGSGIAAGAVAFFDGSTLIGNATLDAFGMAVLDASGLAAGSHSLNAVYGGSASFTGSTAGTQSQTINPTATSVVVASSAEPAVFGQALTLTAVVSSIAPGTGVPTGTIVFKDGATVIASAAVDGSGSAHISVESLDIGAHPITAEYAGDSNDVGSTSASITQTVSAASTSTSIASSANASVAGEAVTFTATVVANAPGNGTAGGTATFRDGSIVLGTVTVDSAGTATLAIASLSPGAHSVTATYDGSSRFQTSTSSAAPVTVGRATTTSAVATSAEPSRFGQTVTLTATVSTTAPGMGVPTGTVTFKDGSTVLGTSTLAGSGVVSFAAFTTSVLSVGVHSISVVYSGDTDEQPSTSAVLTQHVQASATTTALSVSASTSVFGESIRFTATVGAVSPGAGTPAGNVTFSSGATVLGTAAIDSSGVAILDVANFAVGTYSVSAGYAGSVDYSASVSAPVTQVVNVAATSTAIGSSSNTSVFGEVKTLSARVSVDLPGHGVASGTVTFKDGSTVLGTSTLDGAGSATMNVSGLAVGAHAFSATYGGSSSFAASTSAAMIQTVQKASTSSSIGSSPNGVVVGDTVVFSTDVAVLAPGGGTPTGTVTFWDGWTSLGTAALDGAGHATFSSSNLGAGSHPIRAEYSGDGEFASSISAVHDRMVSWSGTSSALTISNDSTVFGEAVTYSVTVTSTGSSTGVPVGSVLFKDGSAMLGTVPLDGSGTALISVNSLSVGDHTITAEFDGNMDFAWSTSAPITQTVARSGTAASIVAPTNPSALGASATFSVVVSASAPGMGTPTGLVMLFDGAVSIGTANLNGLGIATISTSNRPAGNHAITAQFAGDTNFAPSTSDVTTFTVSKGIPSTSLGLSSGTSTFGRPVVFSADVSAATFGTPTGVVTFLDGVNVLGAVPLNGAGTASLTTSALGGGSHSIRTVYNGDSNFESSASGASDLVVGRASTSTLISTAASPTIAGSVASFAAVVVDDDSGARVSEGIVTFYDGATALGSVAVDEIGSARFETSSLSPGNHTISADFEGTPDRAPSMSVGVEQAVSYVPVNTAPTIVNPATAAQSIVVGDSTVLSALATDDAGEANLTYTWTTVEQPGGRPAKFVTNGTNDAKTTTVKFNQAGSYTLAVVIADGGGRTVISSVSVTVAQTPAKIRVSPGSASILSRSSVELSAVEIDQFGDVIPRASDPFAWSVKRGEGTVDAAGVFTAGAPGSAATVTAASDGLIGSAEITAFAPVIDPLPIAIATIAFSAPASTLFATTASDVLSADGTDRFTIPAAATPTIAVRFATGDASLPQGADGASDVETAIQKAGRGSRDANRAVDSTDSSAPVSGEKPAADVSDSTSEIGEPGPSSDPAGDMKGPDPEMTEPPEEPQPAGKCTDGSEGNDQARKDGAMAPGEPLAGSDEKQSAALVAAGLLLTGPNGNILRRFVGRRRNRAAVQAGLKMKRAKGRRLKME